MTPLTAIVITGCVAVLAAACGDGDGTTGGGGSGASSSTGTGASGGAGGGTGATGGGGSATCMDNVSNGQETGTDCGGPDCDPCGDGEPCDLPSDCESMVCTGMMCVPATCGDGVINGTEACDDGMETATCDIDCTAVECGDGVFNMTAEVCDEGANTATCDDDCTLPECGDGVFNDQVEGCDEGGVDTATCDADCTIVECGDGTTNSVAGEVCDDTNTVDGDGCSADCMSDETCGNGVVDSSVGEACDDANTMDGDGCSANCLSDETCGNGYVDSSLGETCDDGNTMAGDGCDGLCQLELSDVRLLELNVGSADYFAIRNTGTSVIDLTGYHFVANYTGTLSSPNFQFTFPTYMLQPNETLYIVESGATGTDLTSSNLPFIAGDIVTGILCSSACDVINGTNVVDAFVLGGTAVVALPAGITWTGTVTGINGTNEDTMSYLRTQFMGVIPNVVATDWGVGPATH
ncbi:MAG: hypothetical protein R3B72_39815 [Polyangiaceae bacterium]